MTLGSELAGTLDNLLEEMLPMELLLDLAGTDRQLSPQLRVKITSIGLLEIGVPEEQRGLGLGPTEIAELFRVAGWRLLPVGLRNAALVVAPMLAEAARCGLEEFRPQYADLVSGHSGAGCGVFRRAARELSCWQGLGPEPSASTESQCGLLRMPARLPC